jgi:hypothetical protein
MHTRRSIRRSVSQILQLHEDLIAQLLILRERHEPRSESKPGKLRHRISRHVRWRSLDTTSPTSIYSPRRDRWARHSIDTSRPSLIQTKSFMADAKLVMDIAKVFDRFVGLSLLTKPQLTKRRCIDS